jgi:hypothetical protein
MRRLLAWTILAVTLPAAAGAQSGPAPVTAVAVPGSGPIEASSFAAAPAVPVTLIPQLMATPHGAAPPSVGTVTVRAARNADHVGFLLEWSDATANRRTGLDGFGDMAAVAFPAQPSEPPPAPFMGNAGGRVQILQWRADWQTDVERGAISLAELYPHAYGSDFHVEDHVSKADAEPYRFSAAQAMGAQHRSAVQDLMAEGFGSLTPRPQQTGLGHGVHEDGTWRVVITRPQSKSGESAATLAPGTRTHLAVAIWDGAKREVGSRKAWAGWIPLEIAP